MAKLLTFTVTELSDGFVLKADRITSAKPKLGNVVGAINQAVEAEIRKRFPESAPKEGRVIHINVEILLDEEIPKDNSNVNSSI